MKLIVRQIWAEYQFEVFVDENYTIYDLKAKIEYQISLPIEYQRLIIQGRDTEDGRKLLDYNVRDNVIVHLAKRRQPEEQKQQE